MSAAAVRPTLWLLGSIATGIYFGMLSWCLSVNSLNEQPPPWCVFMNAEWTLVIVTTITFGVLIWQAFETRRQAEASRMAMALAHRPQIVVREIDVAQMYEFAQLFTDRRAITHVGMEGDWTRLTGKFTMANQGGNTARLRVIHAILEFRNSMPMRSPLIDRTLPVGEAYGPLPAGVMRRVGFGDSPVTPDQVAAFLDGRLQLYAIGKIVYADDIGNGRRTGFCRIFDREKMQFRVAKDEPDYEYSD